MSLLISSLNSGSNGNCYYIGNQTEAVLVDIGISCREVEKRMLRSGLNMKLVKAIFISHEHSDHIRGVEVFSRKYNLPVYITEKTLRYSGLDLDGSNVQILFAYQKVKIGALLVSAFPKLHDATDPHSFLIEGADVTIGVFTDIGSICSHVIENFKKCNAVFLEANYDDKMLNEGRYPYHLKNRIRSNKGHLSNEQALKLFTTHRPVALSHLILSHLSKDNNCPQLVYDLFTKQALQTSIVVASRYKETEVYSISETAVVAIKHAAKTSYKVKQLSLF